MHRVRSLTLASTLAAATVACSGGGSTMATDPAGSQADDGPAPAVDATNDDTDATDDRTGPAEADQADGAGGTGVDVDDADPATLTVLGAAGATADAGSGTATVELLPDEGSGGSGVSIATRFTGDDRDISIATIDEVGAYSGSGAPEHEVRLVDDRTFYRSIDLGDGWFEGELENPADRLVGVPPGFDPSRSPADGLTDLVAASTPLAEVGPDRYEGETTVAALRALAAVPGALALLVDPATGLSDDQTLSVRFELSGGSLRRVSATPTVSEDGYGDDEAYDGGYRMSVTATYVDLGSRMEVEVPAEAGTLAGG